MIETIVALFKALMEFLGVVFNVKALWERRDEMRATKNLGVLVLSIYLILLGLLPLLGLHFPAQGMVLALLAIAAGVLLLMGPTRLPRGLGVIALAIYLILKGLLPLFASQIAGIDTILALLAIAAGVSLLLR